MNDPMRPNKPIEEIVTDRTGTPAWAAGLKQALADVKTGGVKRFADEKEFLDYLAQLQGKKR